MKKIGITIPNELLPQVVSVLVRALEDENTERLRLERMCDDLEFDLEVSRQEADYWKKDSTELRTLMNMNSKNKIENVEENCDDF